MIVDINETTAIEIEKNLKILSQSVSEIENLVKVSYYNFGKTESKERQKNPYIVKSVIKNLACGHNETNAILLTASEYETTFERVYAIYSEQKKYRSAIVLFAKRYMCAKLKRHGFTAKEISKILNVSENHIFRLLNNAIDYWSPKTKIYIKRKR